LELEKHVPSACSKNSEPAKDLNCEGGFLNCDNAVNCEGSEAQARSMLLQNYQVPRKLWLINRATLKTWKQQTMRDKLLS
jgi:hypothetical protein